MATILIDGTKLKAELKKRGYSLRAANTELGRSKAFLDACIGRGCLTESTARSLDAIFNLKREAYELVEKVEEPKKASGRLDIETFYKLIADAVFEGVTRALEK